MLKFCIDKISWSRKKYKCWTKVVLFTGDKIETYEKNPVRGFMSSMEIPMHIGWESKIDSAFLMWPDNSFEKITMDTSSKHLSFKYKRGVAI